MQSGFTAPWHKESFDRFLQEHLPRLLAERLPLTGYSVSSTSEHCCAVTVSVGDGANGATAAYENIACPDDNGLFHDTEPPRVIVPLASSEEIDTADIRCAGEQLYDYVEQRLGTAPAELSWDENLLRSWLPLDTWLREFPASHLLDNTNWLAAHEHPRRILVMNAHHPSRPSQHGLLCPIVSPEGPNFARVRSITLGAVIRERRLVAVDGSPTGQLSLNASFIPFVEHNDTNRTLMGANMMRQWCVPDTPEPALVRTGTEPAAPRFWCGRNMLTAFMSLGGDTHEDGIVVSESAAARLDFPHALEVGDKLSNRHGTKGVISRILPDNEMPHLPDGTPMEIVFDFIGCLTRMNAGQVLEAVMGRVARAEGQPVVVPQFESPPAEAIRARLVANGLPDSGMETLTLGADGPKLERTATVGWVYWGKTHHLAATKLRSGRSDDAVSWQYQGALQLRSMRDAGATENVRDATMVRHAEAVDPDHLRAALAAGAPLAPSAPSPAFQTLATRLAAAGIVATFDGAAVSFAVREPDSDAIELAEPLPHPWIPGYSIARVGFGLSSSAAWQSLLEANKRMQSLKAGRAPEMLLAQAREQLRIAVDGVLATGFVTTVSHDVWHVTTESILRSGNRTLLSARSVIAPGPELRHDQVGLPEAIAWELFGPLVEAVTDAREVRERSPAAREALDTVMGDRWVCVFRPALVPPSTLAFHAVAIPDKAIRLPLQACPLMDADFDGDQASVFLPAGAAAQVEAGERLSIAGHLRRDPGLASMVCPTHASMWGLAYASLRPEGRARIEQIVGRPVAAPEGHVTRQAIGEAVRQCLEERGVESVLDTVHALTAYGFECARRSGASFSPFLPDAFALPQFPDTEDNSQWRELAARVEEEVASRTDFDNPVCGPQLLSIRSEARGAVRNIALLTSGGGADVPGSHLMHGFCQGLSADELFGWAEYARESLGELLSMSAEHEAGMLRSHAPGEGFGVLSRARRSREPGIVFGHAAAIGEVDRLGDIDSRLFVGLPATGC